VAIDGRLWRFDDCSSQERNALFPNDHRDNAARQDWRIATKIFLANLKMSGVSWLKRSLMFFAVHSCSGWSVFRIKPYSLKQRMNDWLPHTDSGHDRER